MDSFIIIGLLLTLLLLGAGAWLSWYFYQNDSESRNKIKDQLFIWFNGDLIIKICLVWVVILLLDTISGFETKIHHLTHPF